MRTKYPPKNPRLPAIPGVELVHRRDAIYAWEALTWSEVCDDWVRIARAPWKKLCWKQAKKYMEQMG